MSILIKVQNVFHSVRRGAIKRFTNKAMDLHIPKKPIA